MLKDYELGVVTKEIWEFHTLQNLDFRFSRNGTSEKYKVQEPNKSGDFYNKLHFYTLSITKVSQ